MKPEGSKDKKLELKDESSNSKSIELHFDPKLVHETLKRDRESRTVKVRQSSLP